jgi:hypothetical protein
MFPVRCWKYQETNADGQPEGSERCSFFGFIGTHTRLQESVVSAYLGESPTFSCASPQWVEVMDGRSSVDDAGAGAGAGAGRRDWRHGDALARLLGPHVDRRLVPEESTWPGAVHKWVEGLRRGLGMESVDGIWHASAAIHPDDLHVYKLQVRSYVAEALLMRLG